MLRLISKYSIFLNSFILLVLYYFSVNLKFYVHLYPIFGILEAYLIDNFAFLFLFLIFLLYYLIRKKINIRRKDIVIALCIFLFFLSYLLTFQGELLNRYFVKDDLHQLLVPLNYPERIHSSLSQRSSFFYYQFPFFSLAFYFFGYNAFLYNIVAVASMALAGSAWFYFLYWFKKHYLNPKNSLANLSILFLIICTFLTSTSIMDTYTYMENSIAIGLILFFSLLSILYYVFYLELKGKHFYILALTLILFLVKSSDVRTAFIPLILIILEFYFLIKDKTFFKKINLLYFFSRIVALASIFVIKNESYFNPKLPGKAYGFSLESFIDLDRLYLVFSNTIPSFISYPVWTYLYKIYTFYVPVKNFSVDHINNNILFTFGCLLYIAIFAFTLFLSFRKKDVLYVIFFGSATLVSMAFFMLFGNVEKKPWANSYDMPYIIYGDTPGSRYYLFPAIFMYTTLYLLISKLIKFLPNKIKVFLSLFFFITLTIFISSDIYLTKAINTGMTNNTMIPLRVVTEKVLEIVPDNGNNKIVYSTSGIIKVIQFWSWDGFSAMYKNNPPYYAVDEPDLIKVIKEKNITRENFYSFYFNPDTLEFKDFSEEYRNKYSKLFD